MLQWQLIVSRLRHPLQRLWQSLFNTLSCRIPVYSIAGVHREEERRSKGRFCTADTTQNTSRPNGVAYVSRMNFKPFQGSFSCPGSEESSKAHVAEVSSTSRPRGRVRVTGRTTGGNDGILHISVPQHLCKSGYPHRLSHPLAWSPMKWSCNFFISLVSHRAADA